jgi:hypothetical protein
MTDDQGVMLSREAARTLSEMVREYQARVRGIVPRGKGGSILEFAKTFQVTTAIQAATAQDTPGTGQGTMRYFDPTTGKFLATANTGIAIWNLTHSTIAVGAIVQCISMDGEWFVDVTDCSNGTAATGTFGAATDSTGA